tara:strand:+ start:5605 stop:7008 length:1404 start_codon:yes stop_codon:yes gene_type:complete
MSCLSILTKKQILQSEKKFIKRFPNKDLIRIASQKLWNNLSSKIKKKKVFILSGPGNNGEDGRQLFKIAQDSSENLLEIFSFSKALSNQLEISKKVNKLIQSSDIIIDSIFGIGLNRKVNNFYKYIFKIVNESKKYVISIDVPSGVFCDNGTYNETCVCADETYVMGYFKPCHFLLPAKQKCGKKTLVKLGLKIPPKLNPKIQLITDKFVLKNFPKNKIDDHKYKRGSVLVLGGKMAGASRLVALASRKIGAGLSTIKISSNQIPLYSGAEPGTIINYNNEINLQNYSAVVIGPGLGKDFEKEKIIQILKDQKIKTILDADGFSMHEKDNKKILALLRKRKKTILTPHDGEFKKFFKMENNSKIEASLKAAKFSNSIVIYKGNDTVIATPEGKVWVNDNAFENLATAGSGDILCGLIAGILSRNKDLIISSIIGVWFQGKLSQNSNNLIAEDFIYDIPYVMNKLVNE